MRKSRKEILRREIYESTEKHTKVFPVRSRLSFELFDLMIFLVFTLIFSFVLLV